jgi:hypothetical protein
MSVHAMRKIMTTNTNQAHKKAISQNPQESNIRKQVGEVGEPYSDSVIRREQPESMIHVFSKPLSITYIGREEVDGCVLELIK